MLVWTEGDLRFWHLYTGSCVRHWRQYHVVLARLQAHIGEDPDKPPRGTMTTAECGPFQL